MRPLRDTVVLVLVLAATAGIYTPYVLSQSHSWDETLHVKAALHDTSDYLSGMGYVYSKDHPTLKRLIYRWVLHSRGITSIDTPNVLYKEHDEKWNIENGRVPPMEAITPLRVTNAAFMTAAVGLLFLTALMILKNGPLAALVALPLAASERIAAGVVWYIGCDAILAFFLALGVFLFVDLVQRGKASTLLGVLVLGAAGGLATSAKFNGALLVLAFMAYLAIYNTGKDRILRPLLMWAASVLVFVMLNPVVRGGGLDWTLGTIWGMLERRERIWLSQYSEAPLSRVELVARFFPYAVAVLPALSALVALRRKKWALPLVILSAVLVVGTLLSVNRTYKRYYLPIELAVFTTGGILAWAFLKERLAGRGATWRGALGFLLRMVKPAAVAALAALVVVTSLAAFAVRTPRHLAGGSSAARPFRKAALFYRQSAAYYGLAEPLRPPEARRPSPAARPAERTQAQEDTRAMPLTLTKRVASLALFLCGMALVYLAAARLLGGRLLAAAAIAPFLWNELVASSLLMHQNSDCYLVFFTGLFLYVWFGRNGSGRARGWAKLAAAACAAGAASAASARGAGLAATAAVLVFAGGGGGGRRRLLKTGAVVAVAAVTACVLAPVFLGLSARSTFDFTQAMFAGVPSHWTARFADTTNFLLPIQECLPYWPLLPMVGVMLYAARKERWALPLAVYAAIVVARAVFCMSKTANFTPADISLALTLAGGVPAMWLLGRQVKVNIELAEPELPD